MAMGILIRNRRWLAVVAVGALIAYCLMFVVLSNTCSYSENSDMDGYYFASPTSDNGQSVHEFCCLAFWPLIEIDARLISGRRPAAIPLYELSRRRDDRHFL